MWIFLSNVSEPPEKKTVLTAKTMVRRQLAASTKEEADGDEMSLGAGGDDHAEKSVYCLTSWQLDHHLQHQEISQQTAWAE